MLQGWLAWTLLECGGLTSALGARSVDSSWLLVVGGDALEQTAAQDLRHLLHEHAGVDLPAPVSAAQYDGRAGAIIIGTVEDNAWVQRAATKRPFHLQAGEAESYHVQYRDGRLYIVGASPKGAMNGVFRLDDLRRVDFPGLDQSESPAFHFRVGGFKMNQTPPPDWSEEDQARYFARHYINVVWGEKLGAPMGIAARRKYGLGLMAEVRFPPVSEAWRQDPANAAAVYRLSAKRDWKVVDPFEPRGRQAYKQAFESLLHDNPDLRILYGVFGDYNAIPDQHSLRVSDGAPYGHTKPETMKEILAIMKEVCGDRDILQVAWMWHAFFGQDQQQSAFMEELAQRGFGAVYNEAGNSDCWIIKRDNFDPTALKVGPDDRSAYGPAYLPLVSAGGACESINPVIGIPLPRVAAGRISRLVQAGVRNFCVWWAGYEGWVYQPNNEVVSELIWQPQAFAASAAAPFEAKAEGLLQRIARRDFGDANAAEVLEFWRLLDRAIVTDVPLYQPVDKLPPPEEQGLHIYDWYQRMGVFTEPTFGGPYPLPLTPTALAGRKEILDPHDKRWMKTEHAQANYAAVLHNLELALEHLEPLRRRASSEDGGLPPAVAQRVGDMYRWSALYRHLLASQYDFMRAVTVLSRNTNGPTTGPGLRQAMAPIAADEVANDEALLRLINRQDRSGRFASNFNIRQNMEGVWENKGSLEDESALLRNKIAAMRLGFNAGPNLAQGAQASASSEEKSALAARFAVDGDETTRWSSQYRDEQWLQLDLGQPRNLGFLQLRWNPAYAASYTIQIRGEAAQAWQSVYSTQRGVGGVETVALPTPVRARYLKILFHHRATMWGFSLNEVSLYGPQP